MTPKRPRSRTTKTSGRGKPAGRSKRPQGVHKAGDAHQHRHLPKSDRAQFDELLRASGLSIIEAARELGVDRSAITRWRSGSVPVPRMAILALQAVCGLPPEDGWTVAYTTYIRTPARVPAKAHLMRLQRHLSEDGQWHLLHVHAAASAAQAMQSGDSGDEQGHPAPSQSHAPAGTRHGARGIPSTGTARRAPQTTSRATKAAKRETKGAKSETRSPKSVTKTTRHGTERRNG